MKLKLKDPWSAITHGVAGLLAIAGAAPLLLKAASGEEAPLHIAALAVFMLTMILLYTASTVYHSVDSTEKVNRRLRKMDHMMIFVMIAGSYTPVCLIALHNHIGYILCGLVWGVAILGMLLKGLWITCPKWLSSVLYIGMGWLCVLAFVPIFHSLPRAGFGWLLAGGIIYTVHMRSFMFSLCLEVPATLSSCIALFPPCHSDGRVFFCLLQYFQNSIRFNFCFLVSCLIAYSLRIASSFVSKPS